MCSYEESSVLQTGLYMTNTELTGMDAGWEQNNWLC